MTGKPLLDKILIALNVFVLLGALGLYFYSMQLEPKLSEADELKDFNSSSIAQNQNTSISFSKITVNLSSERGKLHFLDAEVHIVPINEKYIEKIQKDHKDELTSIIIETASAMTPDEVTTVSGKILLAEKIKKNINLRLGQKMVKQILFTRFVIQ